MQKSLRALLVVAAAAVIGLVVRDYVGSRGSPLPIPLDALPTLAEDMDARSLGWRWTQSTGDSTRIEVSAAGFVQGADGRETVLRSVVLKIFHDESGNRDRIESAEMRMLASGELYSEGETIIALGVSDREGTDPVVARTAGVIFEPSQSRARTDRPVRYEFQDGYGTSHGADYDAGAGTLRMLSEVRLHRLGSGFEAASALQAGGLLYREGEARIDLSGGVSVRQGGRWMECETATLWLEDGRVTRVDGAGSVGGERTSGRETAFSAPRVEAGFGPEGGLSVVRGRGGTQFESLESGQRVEVRGDAVDLHYASDSGGGRSRLRTVHARESAHAGMHVAGSGLKTTVRSDELMLEMRPGSAEIDRVETLHRGTLSQSRVDGTGPRRTLEADRIRLAHAGDARTLGLLATGAASLVQASGEPGGPALRSWSERLEAEFDQETSGISRIRQRGMFRFEEGPVGQGPPRRGSAGEAVIDLDSGQITLTGSAAVSDGESRISADRIDLDRESGRLAGRGSVAAHFAPAAEGAEKPLPTGLFAGHEPLYAAADELESDPERAMIEYRGGARLWQGGSRIDADLIAVDSDALAVRASGSLTASWVDAEDSGRDRPERSEIAAAEMIYEESSGEAVFSGGVDFRRGGMRALSDELRTSLGGASKDRAASAVATGGVRIVALAAGAGTRGFGDRAEFRLTDSEVTLTGGPARILAPDGSETRGGRLTFRAAGDSLQVLGRGAERAYTYRPASE